MSKNIMLAGLKKSRKSRKEMKIQGKGKKRGRSQERK